MQPEVKVAIFLTSVMLLPYCIAILKYKTAAEALKIFTPMSAIFGVLLGVIGTYFFTKQEVMAARQAVTQAKLEVKNSEMQLAKEVTLNTAKWADVYSTNSKFVNFLVSSPDDASWAIMKQKEPVTDFVAWATDDYLKKESSMK